MARNNGTGNDDYDIDWLKMKFTYDEYDLQLETMKHWKLNLYNQKLFFLRDLWFCVVWWAFHVNMMNAKLFVYKNENESTDDNFVMMNLLFHDYNCGWTIIRNLNEEKKLNLLFSGMEKRC